MTHLVLVRHGQASFGAASYDVLSKLGARQSEVLGKHWQRLKYASDIYYSGAMARQKDTALKALENAGISADPVINPAFNEYEFEKILRAYLPVLAREYPDIKLNDPKLYSDPKQFQHAFEVVIGYWLENRVHDGKLFESWQNFSQRVLAGLREVCTPDRKRVTIFTSGGIITVALREALQINDTQAFRMNWRIANASVHEFRVGKRGLSLLGFNNTTHLELEHDTSLMTFR